MPIWRRTATGSIVGAIDIVAAEMDLAFEAEAADQIVHAVQAAQHGALAAARGADEGRDRALFESGSSCRGRL